MIFTCGRLVEGSVVQRARRWSPGGDVLLIVRLILGVRSILTITTFLPVCPAGAASAHTQNGARAEEPRSEAVWSFSSHVLSQRLTRTDEDDESGNYKAKQSGKRCCLLLRFASDPRSKRRPGGAQEIFANGEGAPPSSRKAYALRGRVGTATRDGALLKTRPRDDTDEPMHTYDGRPFTGTPRYIASGPLVDAVNER